MMNYISLIFIPLYHVINKLFTMTNVAELTMAHTGTQVCIHIAGLWRLRFHPRRVHGTVCTRSFFFISNIFIQGKNIHLLYWKKKIKKKKICQPRYLIDLGCIWFYMHNFNLTILQGDTLRSQKCTNLGATKVYINTLSQLSRYGLSFYIYSIIIV